MSRYQVGDVVQLVIDNPDSNYNLLQGDIGEVVKISGNNLGVDWGKRIGHDIDGILRAERRSYGWWVKRTDVVLYDNANVQLDTDMLDSLLRGGGF